MAAMNPDLVKKIRDDLPRLRSAIYSSGATDQIHDPSVVYSNTGLLLDTLSSFLSKQADARYLPVTITSRIQATLEEVDTAISAIPAGADDPTPVSAEVLGALLLKLDELYAICLQYGVVSFGFNPKEAQAHVNRLLSLIEETERARDKSLAAISAAQRTVEEQQVLVQTALTDAVSATEADKAALKGHASEIAAAVEAGKTASVAAQASAAAAAEVQSNLSGLATSTAAEETKILEAANLALTSSRTIEKEIVELQADAKANAKLAADAKAAVEVTLKSISDFYGEIALHKTAMADVKNEATLSVNELKESTKAQLEQFLKRTDVAVKSNETLTQDADRLLHKATGVSLFHAFDRRRATLFRGALFWAILTLSAAGFAAWLAFEFAMSLSTGTVQGITALARLLIAIPVGFLVGFAARQYSRERRAQEEYAFKATISLSLVPYKKLIDEMGQTGAVEDKQFLKDRIKDIFDNPTKRLYPQSPMQGLKDEDPEPAPVVPPPTA